jgi:hypothetical protein
MVVSVSIDLPEDIVKFLNSDIRNQERFEVCLLNLLSGFVENEMHLSSLTLPRLFALIYGYEEVGEFVDGLATAKDKAGCMHINLRGLPAYNYRYEYVSSFSENYAVAMLRNNDANKPYYAHINKKGEPIYEERYYEAGHFKEGFAVVADAKFPGINAFDGPLNLRYFHIDVNGKRLYKNKYHYASPFSDGIAKVTIDNESYYIDINGERID